MNNENKKEAVASPNDQYQSANQNEGYANGMTLNENEQNISVQVKPKQPSKLISASLIMIVSGFAALIGLAMFIFSDVRHAQDYLLPIVMILQLVFAIALFRGKRWGLIGYSVLLLALFAAIFIYYSSQPAVAKRTALGISPILLPIAYLWLMKRKCFN